MYIFVIYFIRNFTLLSMTSLYLDKTNSENLTFNILLKQFADLCNNLEVKYIDVYENVLNK